MCPDVFCPKNVQKVNVTEIYYIAGPNKGFTGTPSNSNNYPQGLHFINQETEP